MLVGCPTCRAPDSPATATTSHRSSPPSSGSRISLHVEQHDTVVTETNHIVQIDPAPFVLLVHVAKGAPRDQVWVNAAFSSRTVDAMRLGKHISALPGFRGASRVDAPGYGAEVFNNQNTDIWLDESSPNDWEVCARGVAKCNGFDGPCQPTAKGQLCRRTVRCFTGSKAGCLGPTTPAASRTLFITALLPAAWTDDEREGIVAMRPDAGRDWLIVRWK